MSDRFPKLRWAASDTYRPSNFPESRPSTFDMTGWRGFIAPVRVDGWVRRHLPLRSTLISGSLTLLWEVRFEGSHGPHNPNYANGYATRFQASQKPARSARRTQGSTGCQAVTLSRVNSSICPCLADIDIVCNSSVVNEYVPSCLDLHVPMEGRAF